MARSAPLNCRPKCSGVRIVILLKIIEDTRSYIYLLKLIVNRCSGFSLIKNIAKRMAFQRPHASEISLIYNIIGLK